MFCRLLPTDRVGFYQQNNQMAIEKSIGRKIAKLRHEKKLTQEDLAGMTEMDRSYISEIENGYKNFSIGSLKKIADALEVKIRDLIDE